jgi:hypothetical protein
MKNMVSIHYFTVPAAVFRWELFAALTLKEIEVFEVCIGLV